MINTENKSIILNWVVILIVLLSLIFTYYRSFISKDYEIIPIEDNEDSVLEEGVQTGDVEETVGDDLSVDQVFE
ncbi:MAG: hypothetical protein U0522_03440 [Candidatus Paceibacterota bacterium]